MKGQYFGGSSQLKILMKIHGHEGYLMKTYLICHLRYFWWVSNLVTKKPH
jgi:hypothetical protein